MVLCGGTLFNFVTYRSVTDVAIPWQAIPASPKPGIASTSHSVLNCSATSLVTGEMVWYSNDLSDTLGVGLEENDELMLDRAAEELRMAIREVGRITGKVGVEDILDVVFSDFCIGK